PNSQLLALKSERRSQTHIGVPSLNLKIPMTALTELPDEEREAKVLQLAREEAERPFDLVNGPLLRVSLFRLANEDHVLLLNMHHIVSDAWSASIFVWEFGTLYKAFSAGRLSPLSELRIQYADYAYSQ